MCNFHPTIVVSDLVGGAPLGRAIAVPKQLKSRRELVRCMLAMPAILR